MKYLDKLWLVKKKSEKDGLCYMTLDEKTKACDSKKQTGLYWANEKENSKRVETHDNIPLSGHVIDDYGWRSRGNKTIRVKDPRGFMVETPVYNFIDTLQHCLIDKGVVKTECVWTNSNSGHLLIPMSQVQVREEAKPQKEKPIPAKDMVIGATYHGHGRGIYLGKLSFDVKIRLVAEGGYWFSSQTQQALNSMSFEKTKNILLEKQHCFLGSDRLYLYKNNPATKRDESKEILDIRMDLVDLKKIIVAGDYDYFLKMYKEHIGTSALYRRSEVNILSVNLIEELK